MKNSLSIAYGIKRRNMARGGMANPKLQASHERPEHLLDADEVMCAHGGPIHCASGCYDEGGEVGDEGYADHEDIESSDAHDQHLFDEQYDPKAGQVMNEETDDEEEESGQKKGRLLSRVLGRIMGR